MNRWSRYLIFTAALMLVATSMFAQATGGALLGRVTDDTGGALPGVTVTATNDATGFHRSVVTGSDGSYRFASLPVGTYDVTADLAGFASTTTSNVEVNVATDRSLNITLKQAAVKEQITVTAASPLIETTPSHRHGGQPAARSRTFRSTAASSRTSASLAPGTTLSVNSDPTKPGQLTIALNGGIGRNVNFLVDGGDNTDDTIGGALQNFNIESGAGVQHPDAAVQGRVRPLHRRRAHASSPRPAPTSSRRQRLRVLPRPRASTRRPRPRSSPASASSPTAAISTAPRSAARSSRTRPSSSPPARRPSATTAYTVEHRRRSPRRVRRAEPFRIPFKDDLLTAKVSAERESEAVPAGPLRLSEELRQVRRRARSPPRARSAR